MYVIKVTEDNIASVMFMDKYLEKYPEPYRGNADITLAVSFETYKKFINKYLEVTDYLSTSTVLLRSYLSRGYDDLLCKCFYRDMANAVVKELWYAREGRSPTSILHLVEDGHGFGGEYIDALYTAFPVQLSRAALDLQESLSVVGYTLPDYKMIQYDKEWRYATVLYAMSSLSNEYGTGFSRWSLERGVRV